jgi:hypothetical protein
MYLLLKNIDMESMMIPCLRFKPKQSLSLRSSGANSSTSNFKLSILLLRRVSQREKMGETPSRITRITRGRSNARTISSWPHRKIDKIKMEKIQILISKSHMAMNKKMKE